MAPRYDTYCGLYCGACDTLLANEEGRLGLLARKCKMSVEALTCRGCKSGVASVWCMKCEIRRCALARRVEFCFECADYPCDRLRAFAADSRAHHSVVLKNLEAIRVKGVAAWLEEQKSRWSCPQCGTRSSWYDRRCRRCRQRLYDCRDEEADLRSEEGPAAGTLGPTGKNRGAR
ncbi:MAG: DUF3795 domain-containing protein [Firmicutes bacterium]|nr:DUF3795 domain-containing protein [Bacillota bacterium]